MSRFTDKMLDFDTFSKFTKFERLSILPNGKSERY